MGAFGFSLPRMIFSSMRQKPEQLIGWFERHWDEVALLAFNAYVEHGRGALAMNVESDDLPDDNSIADLGFILEDNLLAADFGLTEESKTLVR